jgi:AAA domain-containing protein
LHALGNASAIAHGFLESWFKHVETGFIQLTFIRDGRVSTSSYPIEGGFDLAVDEAVRRNANGDNCYIRTAPISRIPHAGSRGDESFVAASPGMWAEVDVSEAGGHKQEGAIASTFEAARNWIDALPIKPSIVIHSGGGFHLYWRAEEPREFGSGDWMEGKRDACQFEAMLQKRAREFGFGLDPNITRNFACLLRLPGLVNWKRAAGHVVAVEVLNDYEYSWDTFQEVADLVLDGDNPETYLYANGREGLPSPGGERGPRGRNDTLKAMVAACLANSKGVEETVREVVSYDMRAHDPPLFMDPTEPYAKTGDAYTNALGFVSSIMGSIHRQAAASGRVPDFGNSGQIKALASAPTSTDDPFKDVSTVSFADSWADRSAYEPHLLESLIPKGTLSVLAGPPKSQKSLMLLELAVKMATGEPWFGFRPLRPLRVLVIQFEMSLDMMRSRVHNFRPDDGFSPAEMDMLDRNLIMSDKAVAPFNRDSFPHYLNFSRRCFPDPGAPPDVLVFDPLQNMYDGNENSNAEMFVFLRLLDELRDTLNPDAGIILLHHANKTNRRDMLEDPFNALRGASALRGYYSSAIFVSRTSEESDERKIFFDVRAGRAPNPKTVLLSDGEFHEVSGTDVAAGETQLEAWNVERRRQRDRIMLEINERAHGGELYAPKELSETLAGETDLPGARRIRVLLSEYATRGYLRFCSGEELGLQALDNRSHGYVVTELTELADDYGTCTRAVATHQKDRTNGYVVEIPEREVNLPWHYDDREFSLELIDPDSNVSPFVGRR